jgi:hypothetical protein
MSNTFTVTHATGSHKLRTFGFVSSGASSVSVGGKHWRTLVTSRKYDTDEEALKAAKNLRRPKAKILTA